MAYTKAQLEAIKNTLLASNQPILANQHREQIQSMIDEMYDAQSRADILVGVQADTITGGSDTFIVFRNGEAYQIPLSLLSANSLANLGDVFISNLEDGNTLIYNAVAERWENQNIFLGFAISNLDDVELTSLANGDILRYESTSEKWENTSLANILSPYALLTDLNDYQLLSEKGQANGYAQLDTGAKLPISIIPDSVLGQVEYQGTWNADTNTPTLPATPDKKGDYYVVSEAGTFVGIDFEVGDWIISNGTAWEKVNNTDAVRTVFGRLGDIVANASDYSAFYVTLDTSQTIAGFKTFSSIIFANDGVRLQQAGSSSSTRLVNLASTFITASGTNQFGFNSSNNIYFAGSNKFGGQLAWNNTGNRTYTLQDASGTIALTSDLHNPVTLGTANGLSLTGQELSLGLASGSTNGALSSDDWNTFNDKQNALTNPVTGTGTTNFLSKFTGSGSIGDSAVFESGGNVGIGTTSPAAKLDVSGDILVNVLTVGRGAGNIFTNTVVGRDALRFNTTGSNNTAIGINALLNNTQGSNNLAMGPNALGNNTTGGSNTAVGRESLRDNTEGDSNTAVGQRSLGDNTTGNFNIGLGRDAGRRISNGNFQTITNNSVFLGRDTRALANDQTNQIVIGHNAVGAGSNTVTLGNTSIVKTVLRGTLNAANLPTSAAGLQTGDIYNDGGTLKIA